MAGRMASGSASIVGTLLATDMDSVLVADLRVPGRLRFEAGGVQGGAGVVKRSLVSGDPPRRWGSTRGQRRVRLFPPWATLSGVIAMRRNNSLNQTCGKCMMLHVRER